MCTENTTPDTVQEDTAAEPTEQTTPTEKAEKAEKKSRKSAAVAKLEEELAAAQDQYQRVLAEYANYKRRTEQEKAQIGEFTTAQILTALLTSVDNMQAAIAADPAGDYKAGVDMVMRQFMEALGKLGLEEIEAEGAPFDPNVHNAVMREDADGVEPDTVTQVFQRGYKLGTRVLRPAMVKVAN